MDERAVRLECLRLALTTNPTHTKPPIERAKDYATFVMGEEPLTPEKSDTAKPGAKARRSAPDGQGGKTPRQPGETG